MDNKILWFHRYTSYYLYRWYVLIGDPLPKWGVLFGGAGLIFFNLLNINLLIKYFWNVELISIRANLLLIFLLSVFVLILNYFYLFTGKRLENLKLEFENQPDGKIKLGRMITLIYFCLTLTLFIVLEFLTAKM